MWQRLTEPCRRAGQGDPHRPTARQPHLEIGCSGRGSQLPGSPAAHEPMASSPTPTAQVVRDYTAPAKQRLPARQGLVIPVRSAPTAHSPGCRVGGMDGESSRDTQAPSLLKSDQGGGSPRPSASQPPPLPAPLHSPRYLETDSASSNGLGSRSQGGVAAATAAGTAKEKEEEEGQVARILAAALASDSGSEGGGSGGGTAADGAAANQGEGQVIVIARSTPATPRRGGTPAVAPLPVSERTPTHHSSLSGRPSSTGDEGDRSLTPHLDASCSGGGRSGRGATCANTLTGSDAGARGSDGGVSGHAVASPLVMPTPRVIRLSNAGGRAMGEAEDGSGTGIAAGTHMVFTAASASNSPLHSPKAAQAAGAIMLRGGQHSGQGPPVQARSRLQHRSSVPSVGGGGAAGFTSAAALAAAAAAAALQGSGMAAGDSRGDGVGDLFPVHSTPS
jgi:hypothetical protein